MKKRLGEMLVDAGYLTSDKLNECILEQKKSGLKLGQFLVRQGLVSERQIVELVSAFFFSSRRRHTRYEDPAS